MKTDAISVLGELLNEKLNFDIPMGQTITSVIG